MQVSTEIPLMTTHNSWSPSKGGTKQAVYSAFICPSERPRNLAQLALLSAPSLTPSAPYLELIILQHNSVSSSRARDSYGKGERERRGQLGLLPRSKLVHPLSFNNLFALGVIRTTFLPHLKIVSLNWVCFLFLLQSSLRGLHTG